MSIINEYLEVTMYLYFQIWIICVKATQNSTYAGVERTIIVAYN